MTETVAFLGAGGTMGRGMAARIADAGLALRAWNRSREKAEPLAEHGAEVLDSAAEAVRGASVVVTMLPDADAVLEVARAALEAAGEDTVWAQMSTIGPDGTDRCAELARERGVSFVDAPVQGTKQPAEEGKLVVMASGPDQTRERLAAIFDAVAQKVIWVGAAGAGTRLKMATNTWLAASVEGLAEALALTEGAGLDPRLFLEVIGGGPLDMPYMEMKAKAMLERDFEPSFQLALAAKDVGLACELAERDGLDLPLLQAVRRRFEQAAEEHGEEDVAAAYLASAPKAAR